MPPNLSDLAHFGWDAFFSAQLDVDELLSSTPVRVVAVHRDRLDVLGPGLETRVPPFPDGNRTDRGRHWPADERDGATVGDWLLLDADARRAVRRLERRTVFRRRAPGPDRRVQLIAANVDTLFVVSSCNADFNLARLERYLALAKEADVTPVTVLTRSDRCDAPERFAERVRALSGALHVECVDARSPGDVERLAPWCEDGRTVALVGSSGVGKSTLVNTLSGRDALATGAIREADAKGRHTTTSRALHRLPSGAWLLDTPGMRELQLTDVRGGIDEVFDDVTALAERCRFADCGHGSEPGCAVRAAIEAGRIDASRLTRWRKLLAEDARNSASLAERRAEGREFGRAVRQIVRHKRRRRDGS